MYKRQLVAKLNGKPYRTEVPLRGFESVPPAPPVQDLTKTSIDVYKRQGCRWC